MTYLYTYTSYASPSFPFRQLQIALTFEPHPNHSFPHAHPQQIRQEITSPPFLSILIPFETNCFTSQRRALPPPRHLLLKALSCRNTKWCVYLVREQLFLSLSSQSIQPAAREEGKTFRRERKEGCGMTRGHYRSLGLFPLQVYLCIVLIRVR